jgi:hypothetical protein
MKLKLLYLTWWISTGYSIAFFFYACYFKPEELYIMLTPIFANGSVFSTFMIFREEAM